MSMLPIDRNPSVSTLNRFGFLWLGFLTCGGLMMIFKSNPHAAWVWFALAVAVPLLGWALPAFMRLVFLGLSYATWPLGFVATHVILALVYYLILTPIGVIMRRFGYDPMRRRLDRDLTSHWIPRPGDDADTQRYFRQF